jgi:hypothetical protein
LIAKDRTSNKNIEEISLYDTAKLNKNRVWLRAFFRNLLGSGRAPASGSTTKLLTGQNSRTATVVSLAK